MIDIPTQVLVDLPVDHLGLTILADLVDTGEWNEYNYTMLAGQTFGTGEALTAIAEAFGWLRSRGLIARDPNQSSDTAIFVTRLGKRVVKEGPAVYFVNESLQGGVHPSIEATARPQFLIGKNELGVFDSLRAVEIRVRKMGDFPKTLVGVDLMNQAFSPTGPLTDKTASKGEQEGMRALFAGAYAVLRNPVGHREIDYNDLLEAADAAHTASLLMRILDRIAQR